MRVFYDPDAEHWDGFFNNQMGSGAYYAGVPFRRGNVQFGGGLGSIFTSAARYLIPLALQTGRQIGKEGLSFGSRVLGKLAEGEPLKNTLEEEGKTSLRNLSKKMQNKFQSGGGKRKRAKSSHSLIGKKLSQDANLFPSAKKSTKKSLPDPFAI